MCPRAQCTSTAASKRQLETTSLHLQPGIASEGCINDSLTDTTTTPGLALWHKRQFVAMCIATTSVLLLLVCPSAP